MTNPTRKDEPIEFRMGELLDKLPPFATPNERNELINLTQAGFKQAREDAFNLLRDALRNPGDDDRWTFLQHCLNGWIESGADGFLIVKYDAGLSDYDIRNTPLPPDTERRAAKVIAINVGDEYYNDAAVKAILESGKVCAHCGAPLTQRDGTWVDRTNAYACPSHDAEHKPEQALFEITHETIELGLQRIRHAADKPDTGTGNWERSLTTVDYLHRHLRNLIIEADLTNEAANLDAYGYAAIVEIACFGRIMYA